VIHDLCPICPVFVQYVVDLVSKSDEPHGAETNGSPREAFVSRQIGHATIETLRTQVDRKIGDVNCREGRSLKRLLGAIVLFLVKVRDSVGLVASNSRMARA
jgi:hypothetical protein